MGLADEVLYFVHAFSDERRKDEVRALARRVADIEAELTAKVSAATRLAEERDAAVRERDELSDVFAVEWDADMRAIKRWQAEDPKARELTWPDRGEMTLWLLTRMSRAEEMLSRTSKRLGQYTGACMCPGISCVESCAECYKTQGLVNEARDVLARVKSSLAAIEEGAVSS